MEQKTQRQPARLHAQSSSQLITSEQNFEKNQLISFEFHNDVLKKVINDLTKRIKIQESNTRDLWKTIEVYKKQFSSVNDEIRRIEEKRAVKQVEIEEQFRKRQVIQASLRDQFRCRFAELKKQLDSHNLSGLRKQIKQFVERNSNILRGEMDSKIQQNSVKIIETVRQNIDLANRQISSKIEQQSLKIQLLRSQMVDKLQKQQNRLKQRIRQQDMCIVRVQDQMKDLKQDILQNIPHLLHDLFENRNEQQDGKVKNLIEDIESKRKVKDNFVEQKIVQIEQREKRLEQLIKQFQIQMLVMGNNITSNAHSVLNERRSSKIFMNRGSINFSKKMSYDVMVQKILLFQQMFTSQAKHNQNTKQKIQQVIDELHSNPMFDDIFQNPKMKTMLSNMIDKFLRVMENKIENKVDVDKYDKDFRGFRDRLDMTALQIIDKCDKVQIKRAFQFLQQKLKDVILLVQGSKEYEGKDPFIEKKQVLKCLSCDKNVDKQRDYTKTASTQYRVWKKVKQNNQTDRVNQLGLGNNSLRKLVRAVTAKNTQRIKVSRH